MVSTVICPFPLFAFLVVAVVFLIEGYRKRITSHFFSGLAVLGMVLLGFGAFAIAAATGSSSELGLLVVGLVVGVGAASAVIGLVGLIRPSSICPDWPSSKKEPKKSSSR